jgi:photosystem II stability/assembly factor-like uncharacterized protein
MIATLAKLLTRRDVRLAPSALWLVTPFTLATRAAAAPPAGKPAASATTPAPKPLFDPSLYQALEWRNIGPFRGGRVVAVAGVPSQPLTYYFGGTGSGIWKTEDAGASWRNVSDGQLKVGTVGAIAVADSDPNVLYAGTGEAPPRGNTLSRGYGVYKSTDAGKTWSHVGLEQTSQVAAVRIHPQNPDLVYVAAQGAPAAPTKERGIYRSRDGGKTWSLVLHVDERTGASDLSLDVTNPRVLYAAFWDHARLPWVMRSGGLGSGLYKSTDGGDTWKKLSEGLPKGVLGKIKVAASPARAGRVYAIVEADEGGVFRSEDFGETWQRTSEDRIARARAWYYTHIIADPKNADGVYVMNAPFLKSTDGGKTWETIRTPHGDNHALWINPQDPAVMINGNDGGANVSLNGGKTWSTQANQPTAQFYRVMTDDRFPYRVYGGQQDNTTVGILSRGEGAITESDWRSVGGCESAHVAFDAKNPRYVYAGCYMGIITEYDADTRQERAVMAYPQHGLSQPASALRYRFNWNAPIVVSVHDPKVIYHAAQVVLRSTDRGASWQAVSGDLTRNEKDKQGPGGLPITNEGAGADVYNTIFAFAESPHEVDVLWAGTDDGLLHVTRDGGRTWTNVTPPGIGEAQINSLEASPHDRGTAWAVVTGYRRNDFTPHVFKTADYGRTWTRHVAGVPEGEFLRVVREDPVRRGLLYAGGERGAYVSWDGSPWQSLSLNLPVVPVTDLRVQGGDLVASTQGRSFWILDDLAPLRAMKADVAKGPFLFRPSPALRLLDAEGGGPGGEGPPPSVGKNPPAGVILRYVLAQAPEKPITLDVLDTRGAVIRSYTSEKGKAVDAPGARAPKELPTKAGMNQFVWDLKSEDVTRVPGVFSSVGTSGHFVAPGQYTVRLKVGEATLSESVDVRKDPRSTASDADVAALVSFQQQARDRVEEIHAAAIRAEKVRGQVSTLLGLVGDRPEGKAVAEVGKALSEKLTAWRETVIQPKQKTFQDVINFRNMLNDQFLYLVDLGRGSDAAPTQGMRERLLDLEKEWAERKQALADLLEKGVQAFNAAFKDAGLEAVMVPAGR